MASTVPRRSSPLSGRALARRLLLETFLKFLHDLGTRTEVAIRLKGETILHRSVLVLTARPSDHTVDDLWARASKVPASNARPPTNSPPRPNTRGQHLLGPHLRLRRGDRARRQRSLPASLLHHGQRRRVSGQVRLPKEGERPRVESTSHWYLVLVANISKSGLRGPYA